MKHDTGKTLSNGETIKLGDKLKGSQTAEVVVLWDEENNEYRVEILGRTDFWWKLDYFLEKWSDLEITGNVNKRA